MASSFLLTGIDWSEAEQHKLGEGAYGTVYEVQYKNETCAGKVIHELLLGPDSVHQRKFQQECRLLSELQHPNIVKFHGVYFRTPSFPVLIVEKLEKNLDDFLTTTADIPFAVKRLILEDVASGLLYLHEHNPPIIHRDLTARNVLLTKDLTAKITDFGQARLVDYQPGMKLTPVPGGLVYMPPEALPSCSQYGRSLDVFSFGHLALFTAVQVFPKDLLEPSYTDQSGQTVRTEVERRATYFELLQTRNEFPAGFTDLIKQCLHNTPERRPETNAILDTLKGMKGDHDDIARLIFVWNSTARRPVLLVTAGMTGMGKSTLINEFLGLEEGLADAKLAPESVTKNLEPYEKEVNGIIVRVIDTPGLEAPDLSDRQNQVNLATLSSYTKGKADLLLYGLRLTQKYGAENRHIIERLTKKFSKEIWKRTIVVLTFANDALVNYRRRKVAQPMEELNELAKKYCTHFCDDLKAAGINGIEVKCNLDLPSDEVDPQKNDSILLAVPAGWEDDSPPEWKHLLFKEVLRKCDIISVPLMLKLQGVSLEEIIRSPRFGRDFTIGAAMGGAVGGLMAGLALGSVVAAPVGVIGGAFCFGFIKAIDSAQKAEYAKIIEGRLKAQEISKFVWTED